MVLPRLHEKKSLSELRYCPLTRPRTERNIPINVLGILVFFIINIALSIKGFAEELQKCNQNPEEKHSGNCVHEDNNTFSNIDSEEKRNDYQCAKWVPESKRNVLFVHALGMNNFTANEEREFMSGEFYATASWDYAIRQNGFNVDEISWQDFETMPIGILEEKYHRIVLGCIFLDWSKKCIMANEEGKLIDLAKKLRHSKVRRKIGVLYVWDHHEGKTPGFFGKDFFHPKQVLTPFDWQSNNTFLGMFPHCVLSQKGLPSAERGRVGLVLGKRSVFFDDDAIRVIQALAQTFTIHTTCMHGDCSWTRSIKGVINHKLLGPEGYAKLIRQASFLLGVGNPIISPSPIIGMANGVAFLNPRRWGTYQHPPLAKEWEPYVYNIENFQNIDDIIEKAESSVLYQNRFSSHIPPDYQVERVINRVCDMLSPNNMQG